MPAEGLGILRDPQVKVLRRGRELVVMTPEIRTFLKEPTPLFVAKANVKSRIHRRVYLDYVGVKILNERGELEGELRVIGLFTSTAYTGSARTIPYLRHKVARVIERAGFDHGTHSGKALVNVPRAIRAMSCSRLISTHCIGLRWTCWPWPSVHGCGRWPG